MALKHAREDVTALLVAVDQLAANLLPGTARPWRAPTMSSERRAQLDAEARLEMLERSGLAPGESPAPLVEDVRELLVDILTAADLLAAAVGQAAGVDRLAAASSAYADPKPYLRYVHEHLIAAADTNTELVADVERKCARLLLRAHDALGLITDGQLLAAICPWCGGRSDSHPVGGDRTLRVRSMPSTSPPEPVVVCEGGMCDPPSVDCGTWLYGRPAWRIHEWSWLADRLEEIREAS